MSEATESSSLKVISEDNEPLNAGAATKTPLKGRLTIIVIAARQLGIHRKIGVADPFVELQLGNEKYKTRVAKDGGINPKWEQGIIFNPDGGAHSSHLRVRVYDQGTVVDTKVGRADIDVYETLSKGYKVAKDFQLAAETDFSKIQGFLNLSIDFEGEGGPTDPIKAAEEQKAAAARAVASERAAFELEKQKLEEERKRLEQLALDARKAQQDAIDAKQKADQATAIAAAATAAASLAVEGQRSEGARAVFSTYHPHELILARDRYGKGKGYTCDVCKKQGGGLGWHCAACSFDAHPGCVEREGSSHASTDPRNFYPQI